MKQDKNSIGRILLILLSIAGMVIMGYLISLHFSPEEGSFCNLGEGLSCDIVNKSLYSKIFGIPMSVLGFLYFLGVFGAVLLRYNKSTLKIIAFLSIVFLGPSLYLTAIEIFVLKNICVLCEASKVLILGIIFVSLYILWPKVPDMKNILAALVLAIIVGGATYFIHAQAIPSGQYDAFSQCLYEKGMRMYGSQGCSFCAKQRALFGTSIEFIHEIECDARYPDSEWERCVAKNISHTPTWILEDENGNDIYRFEPGVQSLEDLGKVANCPLPAEGD